MGHGKGITGQHNEMVARVVVLLVLAMARGVWWCLEQPANSLLSSHTLFVKMLRLRNVHVYRISTSLGHFGAKSMKPLWIYSSIWV